MRRLVVLLVVLVALAVVADRVAVRVAQDQLATRLQSSAGLQDKPTVHVHGFPFLTQALSGRYDGLDLSATDLSRGGVRLARFDADLRGVHVPLSDILHGAVRAVPVDSLTARVQVTFADIAHRSGLVGLAITPAGEQVHVTARLTVLGQSITATAVSDVRLRGGAIVITARSLKALGQASPALLNALTGRLDLRVPIGTLPYGLRLTAVRVAPGGVVLDAAAEETVLTTG